MLKSLERALHYSLLKLSPESTDVASHSLQRNHVEHDITINDYGLHSRHRTLPSKPS